MLSQISDHHWLALCLLTESNLPEEWPCIAWVVRNRVESPRYPDTYEKVILQPMQFSRFNKLTAARKIVLSIGADAVFESERPPFPATVLHYYSPISMAPKGRTPGWAKQAKRLFTPPGIDPERFVFAEGVP